MCKCPNDMQLARFAERRLSGAEEKVIRQHIANCQDCSHLLVDILEINDMRSAGLLEDPPEHAVDRSVHYIREILSKSKNSPRSANDRLNSLFGIAASATFGMFTGTAGEMVPLPAFSGNTEEILETTVRNLGFGTSIIHEDHQIVDHQLKYEGNAMDEVINNGGIQDAPKVVGLPGVDGKSDDIRQGYQDTCAVRSQELILRDFGVQVSEDSLRQEAFDKGWYTPGSGTSIDKVGNLLESHGVEVNRYENANIFTLTNELSKGHKVIIGVDSGELGDKGFVEGFEDMIGIQGADHALIVSGIDTSDPDNVKVVLTDPGTGDIAKEYSMDQFVDAWKDSNCFMVATEDPAPAWLPEMVNFDYSLGHIETIGNLPYETFQTEYAVSGNLSGNELLTEYNNSLDEFLEAVSGEEISESLSNFLTHDSDPFLSDLTPDPINPVNDPLQKPTITDLIQHHGHFQTDITPHTEPDGHEPDPLGMHDFDFDPDV